jgi:hypothetical protein
MLGKEIAHGCSDRKFVAANRIDRVVATEWFDGNEQNGRLSTSAGIAIGIIVEDHDPDAVRHSLVGIETRECHQWQS